MPSSELDPDLAAVWEFFEAMRCPCCGECIVDARFPPALDQLVSLAAPHTVEVVTGYRCEKHNAGARGVSKRAHREGRAADLRIRGLTLAEMYWLAHKVPEFREGGIGVNDDGTIHVDVRIYPARWGRVGGEYRSIAGSGLLKVGFP